MAPTGAHAEPLFVFIFQALNHFSRSQQHFVLFQVFSGYDDSGQSYGRFCGNSLPPEIVSVDEALLLRFKSDDTINSKGFSANYVIIEEAENRDDYEYFDSKPKSY